MYLSLAILQDNLRSCQHLKVAQPSIMLCHGARIKGMIYYASHVIVMVFDILCYRVYGLVEQVVTRYPKPRIPHPARPRNDRRNCVFEVNFHPLFLKSCLSIAGRPSQCDMRELSTLYYNRNSAAISICALSMRHCVMPKTRQKE